MNINRHNYEEFFILYLDKELSREDRASVELFVHENPDLQEEFDLLQQASFVPDTSLVFADKEELLRFAANDSLTLHNYEEWLLLYADNELPPAQKTEVERFAAAHPVVKEELDLLLQTRLQPETITFPFKESLYRHEEKATARVVTIRWWRMAAAAAVLAAVSIGGFYAFKNEGSATDAMAGMTQPSINDSRSTDSGQNQLANAPADDQGNPAMAVTTATKEQPPASTTSQPVNAGVRHVQHQAPLQDNTPATAAAPEKNGNNLPQPAYNPNMKDPIDNSSLLADNNMPSAKPKEINTGRVTPNIPAAYIQAGNQLNSEDDLADAGQSDKKTKFRGLLRKITRTFEKTTNIKATDEDDRLLVGSLAIRL
ncbi:MAG: hypothetical protein ABW019_11520 [Chitinophagaceae bacterium]